MQMPRPYTSNVPVTGLPNSPRPERHGGPAVRGEPADACPLATERLNAWATVHLQNCSTTG